MFHHLLVPLDGSRLAEAALPAAATMAKTLGAKVTLIHVIEQSAPEEIHGEHHLSDPGQARAYLDQIAVRAFPPDVLVELHVHTAEVKDVARSLVEHVEELSPDLIVMCTHGQGGLRTRLFGSMAQQIIGMGKTPVLIIRPSRAAGASAFLCRHLLVPLDGQPDHEQGLPVAASLARAYDADLHLLMVVPTLPTLAGQEAASGRLLPGATSLLLDLSQDAALTHLSGYVKGLQAQGLVVQGEVRRGDPAKVIVRTARKVQADMIVLATHGKSGMDAFWSGSIAPEVSGRAHAPMLLVPVHESPGLQKPERKSPDSLA